MNIKSLYENCDSFAHRHAEVAATIDPRVVRKYLNDLATPEQRLTPEQNDPARLVFVARYVMLPGFESLAS